MVILGSEAKPFFWINAVILVVYVSAYTLFHNLNSTSAESSFLERKKKRFQSDWNNLLTIIAFLGKTSKIIQLSISSISNPSYGNFISLNSFVF